MLFGEVLEGGGRSQHYGSSGCKERRGGNESNSVDTRLVKLMKKMEGEDVPGLIRSLHRER